MPARNPRTRRARSPLLGVALTLMLLGALLPASVLAAGGAPPGTRSGTGRPVVASLRSVPPISGHAPPVALPWAHPGGADVLAREKAAAGQGAVHSGVQSPAPATATGAISAPTVGVPAIDAAQSQCPGCYPPDGAVAAGPNYVVGAVNTAVSVWDKTGKVVIAPVSLPTFLATDPNCPNNFLYGFSDPFVDYDPGANQFVMGMLNFDLFYDSRVCVAVTQTGDPTGQWWLYDFPVSPSLTLFDFPHAAIGSDAVYVTGNLFQNGTTYLGARIYAYNKSAMYSGVGPEQVPSTYQDVTATDTTGQLVDTLMPAKGVGVASTMYFTSVDNCSGCNTVRLWRWSAPFGGNVFTSQGAVNVQPYNQPPDATQLGGAAITTNDTRELAAMWSAGTLYGVHTIGCDPGGGTVDCAQWYQLGNLDGTPSLLQQGIAGTSGQNRFYPTLAVDGSGDLALGYAYSSPSDYAGVRYTGLVAGGTALEPEQVLVAGQTTITTTGSSGRYGDYGMESIDPSDGCTVWHLEEYAQAGQLWGTWLGAFKFNGCGATATSDFSLSATPAAQTVSPGGSAAYTVSLTDLNGFSGSAALVVSGLPAGATAGFSPTSASASTPSTLTVTTTAGTTPGGSYTLTITGTSGSLSHQTTVQLDVSDFTIAASPASLNVTAGGGGTSTVTLTALGGYSSAVTLAVTGPSPLPSGMTATFSPNPVTPTASGAGSTLTIATTSATPAGSYTLTVTGAGADGTTHATTVAVTVTVVTAPPDFAITVAPTSQSVSGGKAATYTVTLTAVNGYGSPVTLSVSGQPSRSTLRWSSNPATPTSGGTTVTLTISTARTPHGTFTLTITGTGAGGTPVHSQTVTLTVTK